MHIVAVRQEPPAKDAQETATGLGISTDRRAPPSHPASSVSLRIPPRQSPSSLTDEGFQPGERKRDRSPWLPFPQPGTPEGARLLSVRRQEIYADMRITFELQVEVRDTVLSFAHRGFKKVNEDYERVQRDGVLS